MVEQGFDNLALPCSDVAVMANLLHFPLMNVAEALQEALDAVETELALTGRRLAEITDQLQNLQGVIMEHNSLRARLDHLADEKRGLELALARRRGTEAPPVPDWEDWRALTRTAAIEQLLLETGRAMSPAEIVAALKARGRENEQSRGVSVALGRLRKRNKVVHGEWGQWSLAQPPSTTGLFDDGEGAVVGA
jgi:hypothetical protein